MKSVIEGKSYNTDTAIEICSWDNEHTGFTQYSETIYKTAKGAYFLYGEGGAASPYSQPSGDNGFIGGSKIIALTEAEALERLERGDDSDSVQAIEEHFAHMIEEA